MEGYKCGDKWYALVLVELDRTRTVGASETGAVSDGIVRRCGKSLYMFKSSKRKNIFMKSNMRNNVNTFKR
jgi:hypothetical protein